MRRMMLITAALAVVLAGCEMSADVTVNEDGSGTFGFSLAMEEAMLEQLPGGGNPLDGFREEFVNDPVPWAFEEINEGDLRGMRATLAFSSIDDLRSKMQLLAEAEGGSPGGFDDTFRIERTDTGWSLQATGEGPGADLGGGFGGDVPSGVPGLETPGFDAGALAELFDVSMRVTLPGTSVSTNATETIVNGGSTTFVWKLDVSSSAPVGMTATTSVAAAGSLPLVPIGIGVVLVGLGLMVAARLRRPGPPHEPVLEGFGTPAPPPADEDELAV